LIFYCPPKYYHSTCYSIKAGVPQGKDIAPFFYSSFTREIFKTFNTSYLGTHANGTLITASRENYITADEWYKSIEVWLARGKTGGKIKISESKSVQVTFSLRNIDCPPVTLNNQTIPTANEDKYLGLILPGANTYNSSVKLWALDFTS